MAPGSSSSPGPTPNGTASSSSASPTPPCSARRSSPYSGEVQIGLICSEKQAIDATLRSLAAEDPRFCRVADRYWNARGGSATDGGSFHLLPWKATTATALTCHDKFGKPKTVPWHQRPWDGTRLPITIDADSELSRLIRSHLGDASGQKLFGWVKGHLPIWSYASFREALAVIAAQAQAGDGPKAAALAGLTLLLDRRYDPGDKKRSHLQRLLMESLTEIFQDTPAWAKERQPLPLG